MDNLVKKEKEIAKKMIQSYEKWAKRIGVRDIIDLYNPKKFKLTQFKPFKKLAQYIFKRMSTRNAAWQQVINERMKNQKNQ